MAEINLGRVKGDPFKYEDFTEAQLLQLTGSKGERGFSLQYIWNGTQLGLKREDDENYVYVDLKGEKGDTGDPFTYSQFTVEQLEGLTGPQGNSIEVKWNGTSLGVRIEGQTSYQYTNLKGEKGDKGDKGDTGEKGDKGETGSIDSLTKTHVETALGYTVNASVPSNAKFTDTNTTYSEITTAEIDAGTASTLRTITGRRVKYILDKVQGWIDGLTKSDVGLGNVLNYGLADQAEAEAGTSNAKYMTPLRTNQAIDNKFRWTDGLLEVNIDGVWRMYNEYIPEPDDSTSSPGSKYLIAGTMEEGFFGEVPASELITGDALASQVGISQGTSQHSTEPWLKFAYKGEILFVAKKPIRHSISWNDINTANCVYGDKGVMIGGKTYMIALMRGLEPSNDPKTTTSEDSGIGNHYSEWNRLMGQIHEEAINKNWSYSSNIESDIGVLEHNLGSGSQGMYSNADLIMASGDGRSSWCQEMSRFTSSHLHRGYAGVSHAYRDKSSNVTSNNGWRPVLRLAEED